MSLFQFMFRKSSWIISKEEAKCLHFIGPTAFIKYVHDFDVPADLNKVFEWFFCGPLTRCDANVLFPVRNEPKSITRHGWFEDEIRLLAIRVNSIAPFEFCFQTEKGVVLIKSVWKTSL